MYVGKSPSQQLPQRKVAISKYQARVEGIAQFRTGVVTGMELFHLGEEVLVVGSGSVLAAQALLGGHLIELCQGVAFVFGEVEVVGGIFDNANSGLGGCVVGALVAEIENLAAGYDSQAELVAEVAGGGGSGDAGRLGFAFAASHAGIVGGGMVGGFAGGGGLAGTDGQGSEGNLVQDEVGNDDEFADILQVLLDELVEMQALAELLQNWRHLLQPGAVIAAIGG